MRENIKNIVNYCVFSAILTIFAVAFVVCYNFYDSFKGCYIVPGSSIELNEVTDNTISVMTYNIRYDFWAQTEEEKLNSWKNRAPIMSKLLNECKPSIICMQEVTHSQEFYMKRFLKGYNVVVNYRENGISAEGTMIFYRTDLFDLVKSETFWLSETPDVVSKSWGSTNYRTCTINVLKDKRTQATFLVADTHLDTKSDSVRLKQVCVILNKIKSYNLPTLLMGDFNSSYYSETIQEVKTSLSDIGVGWADEKAGTYNGFRSGAISYGAKIDWIFKTNDSFVVNKYAVITNSYDGRYPSDHFPIYAELMQNL